MHAGSRAAAVVVVLALSAISACGASNGTGSKNESPSATKHPLATTTTAGSAYRALAIPAPSDAPTCAQAVTMNDVSLLVAAFRAARLRGAGAEGCLSAAALARYDDAHCDETALASSPGPIVLYRCGTHRVVAIPDATIEAERDNPQAIQIEVDLDGTNRFGQPNRLDEHFRVGPGTPAGSHDSAAQVILSVANM